MMNCIQESKSKISEYNNDICKEKCSICQISKCRENNCNNICSKKYGHENFHSCNHKHQCNYLCVFKGVVWNAII